MRISTLTGGGGPGVTGARLPAPAPSSRLVSCRAGMTLVELIMGLVLVSLLALFFFRLFHFQKLSWYNVEKLGVIQELRMVGRRCCVDSRNGVKVDDDERRSLQDELDLATAFLYPPPGSIDQVHRRLVFTGPENDLHIIYWRDDGAVVIRGLEDDPKVLAEKIVDFQVRHPIKGQVCLELTAEDDVDDTVGTVSIGISAFAGNSFEGE